MDTLPLAADPTATRCASAGGDALRTFRDAFVTELGPAELGRLVSLRELLDVIICAGKDCLIQDLRRVRPYATDKDEIFTFDECFQIYQSIPATSLDELYDVFGAFAIAEDIPEAEPEEPRAGSSTAGSSGLELDYAALIGKLEQEGRGELIRWLRRHAHRKTDIENLIYELIGCRRALRSLNAQIVEEEGLDRVLPFVGGMGGGADHHIGRSISCDWERGAGNGHKVSNTSSSYHWMMLARTGSAESLSSLFSNTRNSKIMGPNGEEAGAGTGAAGVTAAAQGVGAGHATSAHLQRQGSRADAGEERIQLKSLVIQRELTETSCIAYAFALDRPRKLRLSVCVNEGIDHSLNRFNNSIVGILMSSEMEAQTSIHAVTRRKESGMCTTDWVSVPTGNHLIRVRFCRALRMVEPERSDHIVDDRSRLTKSFKVMLMNLFDMFDLDDDGLLSRREFEAYSILSGSGPVSEQEWAKVCANFELRQQHITMKTFIQMHQRESETYGPRGTMEEMWKAVRALGHNRRFFMSTTCPLRLELHCSEGGPVLMEPFRVDRFHADELDPLLAEHFWELGRPLPYLRELHTLRQFKGDYYAVLVAGRTFGVQEAQTHYWLDLSASNNVNIEGKELVVNQTVPANTIRILTVAIAQAESWFLSVKLAGSGGGQTKHQKAGKSTGTPVKAGTAAHKK